MNKLKKNLVLTGMMGSGKTTIGKSLSQRLDMGFADIDSIIEKKLVYQYQRSLKIKEKKLLEKKRKKKVKKF